MITRRLVINVIAFLMLSGILITLMAVNLFRIQPRYTVLVSLAETGGVFTGQEVTYRGVTVGRVGEFMLIEDGVRIELVIDERFNRIPADARVRVMFKSAVGEQFVDLLPQSSDPPYLQHRDEIPRERTDLPVQQEDLLRKLSAVLDGIPPESFGNLIDILGEGLGGRGEDLHHLLRTLDPVSAIFARRTGELNRIMESGDRLGAAFTRSSADFVAAMRDLAVVSQTLGRRAPEVDALLRAGATEIPSIAAFVAANKERLDRLIVNLAEVTQLTLEDLPAIEDALDWLPLFLEAIIGSYIPEENRFRIGLLIQSGNEPCDYGTPRRPFSDRTGNAPWHPITEFECQTPGQGAEAGGGTVEPAGGLGTWDVLVTDTLRR